jgi:hypothetical protein
VLAARAMNAADSNKNLFITVYPVVAIYLRMLSLSIWQRYASSG